MTILQSSLMPHRVSTTFYSALIVMCGGIFPWAISSRCVCVCSSWFVWKLKLNTCYAMWFRIDLHHYLYMYLYPYIYMLILYVLLGVFELTNVSALLWAKMHHRKLLQAKLVLPQCLIKWTPLTLRTVKEIWALQMHLCLIYPQSFQFHVGK